MTEDAARDFIERARRTQEAINALGYGAPAPGAEEQCRETDACLCAECHARKFGQSEHGGLEPELAARITAAKAALGDYRRESAAWLSTGDGQPDFASWAERFAADLAGIVGHIERLAQ